MSYFILKALHLISIVTWFAGLFYIVRLFIYHTEAQQKSPTEKEVLSAQFLIMERRLWYGITWPSAIMVLFFGLSLIRYHLPLRDNPWLILKLLLVSILYGYHFFCGKILKELKNQSFQFTSKQLRFFNEVPTIFLFLIVFLAILKHAFTLKIGLMIIAILGIFLFLGIKINAKKMA